MTFTAALLADVDRYPAREDVDLGRDQHGYGQVVLHLTDGEMAELLEDLQSVVLPRLANQPGNDRTKRLLTTIVVPSDD